MSTKYILLFVPKILYTTWSNATSHGWAQLNVVDWKNPKKLRRFEAEKNFNHNENKLNVVDQASSSLTLLRPTTTSLTWKRERPRNFREGTATKIQVVRVQRSGLFVVDSSEANNYLVDSSEANNYLSNLEERTAMRLQRGDGHATSERRWPRNLEERTATKIQVVGVRRSGLFIVDPCKANNPKNDDYCLNLR